MDTDKLNQWLTLAANMAVLGGIVFLAIEIRQNTVMQERQMQIERVSGSMDPYFASGELARIYAKVKAVDGLEPVAEAFVDRYGLKPEEAVLWSRLVNSGWYVKQAHFLTDGPSAELENEILGLHQYPDVRIVFEANEDGALLPEFVEYVESIIGKEEEQ